MCRNERKKLEKEKKTKGKKQQCIKRIENESKSKKKSRKGTKTSGKGRSP